jgi:hypothetical protein
MHFEAADAYSQMILDRKIDAIRYIICKIHAFLRVTKKASKRRLSKLYMRVFF